MIVGSAEMDAPGLLDRIKTFDPLAIARAITAIENDTPLGAALGFAVRGKAHDCRTLGVTGPPGAGKSSLVSALIDPLLTFHPRIAVVTVDPSSPISGGAVLGDRVRMAAHSRNPNIFIRSLAARGHLGGVTRTTRSVTDLLAAAGFDLVIVETVGTGQSEVEVARLTQIKLVVCPPGLGDDMQAIKAGVLEIADLLVVNKADLPDASRTAGHLRAMLHHRGHDETRAVLLASSVTGDGLTALVEAITERLGSAARFAGLVTSDTLTDHIADLVRVFVRHAPTTDIREAIDRREITLHDAAVSIMRRFVDGQGGTAHYRSGETIE